MGGVRVKLTTLKAVKNHLCFQSNQSLSLLARVTLIFVSFGLASTFSQAEPTLAIPECKDHGQVMGVDNARVLNLKTTTQNAFLSRGYVSGPVNRIFPEKNGHQHYEIKLGDGADDVIEVVYNKAFGATPEPQDGMQIQACGDYITSYAPSGPYEASPSKAIIHWVHYNPKEKGHDHGFVVMSGGLYGWKKQGNPSNNHDFDLRNLFLLPIENF